MFKQYVTLINYLFNLRPGVLIKTLSHIWGRLNLPMLLFRIWLLTLVSKSFLTFWCACTCMSRPIDDIEI